MPLFRQTNKSGFTLMEILIIVGIIALLNSLAVIGVQQARKNAKISKAKNDLDAIATAIGQLMVDTGEWPGHQTPEEINNVSGNEIWDLNASSSGIVATDGLYDNWKGPYMPEVRKDPWGSDYFFDTDYEVKADGTPCDGSAGCRTAAVVGSFGPDREGKNLYNADDIIKILTAE